MAPRNTNRSAFRIIKDPTMWVIAVILILLASVPVTIDMARLIIANKSESVNQILAAPNHFWFTIIFFPMVALLTGFILTGLIKYSEEIFSNEHRLIAQFTITHWRVIVTSGIAFAAFICGIDYFFNPKTFDKFQEPYREQAYISVDLLRKQIDKVTNSDQPEQRRINYEAGKSEFESSLSSLRSHNINLFSLSPQAQLYAYTDAKIQLEFKLLDPLSHSLQMISLFGIIFSAWCVLWGWFICLTSPELVKANGTIGNIAIAILASIILFAIWAVLYHVAKLSTQHVIGVGTGTGQRVLDVVVLVFLYILVILLGRTKLMESMSPGPEVTTFILLTAITFATRAIDMRTVLGGDSNLSTVIIISTVSWIIFLAVSIVRVIP